MSALVNSLKRLYSKGNVSEDKIKAMLDSGKISNEEYAFITE